MCRYAVFLQYLSRLGKSWVTPGFLREDWNFPQERHSIDDDGDESQWLVAIKRWASIKWQLIGWADGLNRRDPHLCRPLGCNNNQLSSGVDQRGESGLSFVMKCYLTFDLVQSVILHCLKQKQLKQPALSYLFKKIQLLFFLMWRWWVYSFFLKWYQLRSAEFWILRVELLKISMFLFFDNGVHSRSLSPFTVMKYNVIITYNEDQGLD